METLVGGVIILGVATLFMGLLFLVGTEIYFTIRDRCMPWRHKYQIKGAYAFWLDSDWRQTGMYTDVAYQCSRCNKTKTKTLKGSWTTNRQELKRGESTKQRQPE